MRMIFNPWDMVDMLILNKCGIIDQTTYPLLPREGGIPCCQRIGFDGSSNSCSCRPVLSGVVVAVRHRHHGRIFDLPVRLSPRETNGQYEQPTTTNRKI
jgi:hypothetical protein